MSTNKKSDSTSTKKKKFKFSVNPLLCTVIILVLIPVSILGYSILKSVDSRGVPVVGDRYEGQLPNRITDEQLNRLKSEISIDGMQSIDVTLNAATLRVMLQAPIISADDSKETLKFVYDKINEITPIDTYFTNIEGKKSYDLEVHLYNLIPKNEEEKAEQIYTVLTKTGGLVEPSINVQSSPISEDLTYHLMNPITVEQLEAVKAAINVEGMESSEVKLVNGTVIISVKVPELKDYGVASNMTMQVYDQMVTVLPISDYFSNKGSVERYRLEIHVFNFIPKTGDDDSTQVAAALTKSSSNPEYKIETNEKTDESE